jgi:colanic acid biosynthesis glycosyl transferase WcaI
VKIACYALNFWPELTGCGKYTAEMAAWLATKGHDVEVVTAPPYYPAWRVFEGYSSLRYMKEALPGVDRTVPVRRSPLWVPQRVTGMSRILHLTSFAIASMPTLFGAMRRRPDLLFVVLPTILSLPAALLFARLFGVKVWAHVQDFEVDAAFGLGVFSGNRGFRVASAIESLLLRACDLVSSISPRMVERLQAKGLAPDRAIHFPNWVDLTAIHPLQGHNEFRGEHGISSDEVMCLYAGNMGEKQGLELVVEAARLLRDEPRVRFVLAGDGAARARLQAQSTDLSNLIWLPLQPADGLNSMLNAADIHLLPQRADAADLVMPSKLTGMLASGRSVLGTAAIGTQLGDVLDLVGVRTSPGDVTEFVDALRTLAADATRRYELGQRGRAYAEEHLALDRIMGRFVAQASACCGVSTTSVAEQVRDA